MEEHILRNVLTDDKAIVLDFSGDIRSGTKRINTKFTIVEGEGRWIKCSLTDSDTIQNTLKGY